MDGLFSNAHLHITAEAALAATVLYSLARRRKLETLVYVDPLTATLNQRGFGAVAGRTLRRGGRRIASCIFVDIDDFRGINRMHGHHRADEVLKAVARVLTNVARNTDVVCRRGGASDEFVVFCPDTDITAALEIAERIRAGTEDATRKIGVPTTVSLGVSTSWISRDRIPVLEAEAGRAERRAKARGGNQIAHAQDIEPEMASPDMNTA